MDWKEQYFDIQGNVICIFELPCTNVFPIKSIQIVLFLNFLKISFYGLFLAYYSISFIIIPI